MGWLSNIDTIFLLRLLFWIFLFLCIFEPFILEKVFKIELLRLNKFILSILNIVILIIVVEKFNYLEWPFWWNTTCEIGITKGNIIWYSIIFILIISKWIWLKWIEIKKYIKVLSIFFWMSILLVWTLSRIQIAKIEHPYDQPTQNYKCKSMIDLFK